MDFVLSKNGVKSAVFKISDVQKNFINSIKYWSTFKFIEKYLFLINIDIYKSMLF